MKASPERLSVIHRLLGAIAIMASVAAVSFGSTVAPSSNNAPAAAPYIEQPQQTTTVTTYNSFGPTYYGPSSYGGYYNHDSWYGGYGYSSTYTYYPRRYFFPPNPPALGDPYNKSRTKSASTVLSTIPLLLSEYVNEPFYSPLSPFLYDEDLSKKRQKMVDDYRAAKVALVNELRAHIDSLQGSDAATREAKLAEFAREQTPRIIPVEKMAYDIRDELTRWHLFSSSADWNEGRDWRLGDNTRWESTLDEAKVMRGAAYYQEGLSPAQRRLLREYAMELDDSGRGPTSEIALDARGPYFYFTPETSRLRLPGNLPADLRAKIDRYQKEKTAIKKELRDVLYKEDRRFFGSKRTAAVRALAEKQAPQIAALEPLAEEIRQGLAPLPLPGRPRPTAQTLPRDLADRVAAFMDKKGDYQQTLNSKLIELKRQFPSARVEYVKMDGGFGIQIVPSRKSSEDELQRIQTAKTQLETFNSAQVSNYLNLVREKEGIRDSLVQSSGNLGPLMTARIVDLVLREYSNTLAVQELWRQYRDYEAAVLMPGLSPEQRRILYDEALVKLDQQIPTYTY